MQSQRLAYAGAGVSLAAEGFGAAASPAVLLLHGGGQTRHAWNRTARALAAGGYYAVTLDLRGHGESDWSPNGIYRHADGVDDVRRVAASFDDPPILVGASLGGLLALTLEGLTQPGSTSGIVLVDVAHDAAPQGISRIVDFMESGAAGFASLEEAADAVAAYLAHRKRPASLDGLRKNLRLRDDGRWYWHWDPRMLETGDLGELREAGHFERAARSIRVPVLLVRGAESDVVDERIARELLGLIPHARYVDVAGAQHMVAGDENDAFSEAVTTFCGEITASLRVQ
ncbi:MAG: alpha/beta hydrolase [Candidatus Eremiobacteraeota bacterium]|nr:alpha/beta hydrolase [Candidatus Eremiobacteraeota bacterium]